MSECLAQIIEPIRSGGGLAGHIFDAFGCPDCKPFVLCILLSPDCIFVCSVSRKGSVLFAQFCAATIPCLCFHVWPESIYIYFVSIFIYGTDSRLRVHFIFLLANT